MNLGILGASGGDDRVGVGDSVVCVYCARPVEAERRRALSPRILACEVSARAKSIRALRKMAATQQIKRQPIMSAMAPPRRGPRAEPRSGMALTRAKDWPSCSGGQMSLVMGRTVTKSTRPPMLDRKRDVTRVDLLWKTPLTTLHPL